MLIHHCKGVSFWEYDKVINIKHIMQSILTMLLNCKVFDNMQSVLYKNQLHMKKSTSSFHNRYCDIASPSKSVIMITCCRRANQNTLPVTNWPHWSALSQFVRLNFESGELCAPMQLITSILIYKCFSSRYVIMIVW